MSRQIQIRRGTTTEHASFTGTIGEITMDTDKKTLFVHDGETAGGIELARADSVSDFELPENMDYVIETATGLTGTNYTNGWYRKYKSGWVEQGGKTTQTVSTSASTITVSLPVTMTDNNYNVGHSLIGIGQTNAFYTVGQGKTTTTFQCMAQKQSASGTNIYDWSVKGFIAS